jgi:hypothetical protein
LSPRKRSQSSARQETGPSPAIGPENQQSISIARDRTDGHMMSDSLQNLQNPTTTRHAKGNPTGSQEFRSQSAGIASMLQPFAFPRPMKNKRICKPSRIRAGSKTDRPMPLHGRAWGTKRRALLDTPVGGSYSRFLVLPRSVAQNDLDLAIWKSIPVQPRHYRILKYLPLPASPSVSGTHLHAAVTSRCPDPMAAKDRENAKYPCRLQSAPNSSRG